MTLRALVLGGGGQVGRALARVAPAGIDVMSRSSHETDVRDHIAVRRAIEESGANLIINCAAFTNVDSAESSPGLAAEINAIAPGLIANEARRAGARLLHVSTDYVFDGATGIPYEPGAPTTPINVYGATKREGERALLSADPDATIVRTAWVHSGTSPCFVARAVSMLCAGTEMRVVDDQFGTPTAANHLAAALWRIAHQTNIRGVLHFTDAGVASWFDVAIAVLDSLNALGRAPAEASVVPVASASYSPAARRPPCAVLDKHSSWQSIGWTPPHWRVGVVDSVREILHA
ncbi:MAG: dTDP-4-dehydrorhamnose reductase [Gemmatimonadaceae bacterium]|nr:dTDP-4-dehydrorhamnose reductase [Gemmatimonadaceae bacterium]